MPTAIRSRSRCTAASILRSSLTIRSTISPGASLSIPRLEELIASVGSDCHFERITIVVRRRRVDRYAAPTRILSKLVQFYRFADNTRDDDLRIQGRRISDAPASRTATRRQLCRELCARSGAVGRIRSWTRNADREADPARPGGFRPESNVGRTLATFGGTRSGLLPGLLPIPHPGRPPQGQSGRRPAAATSVENVAAVPVGGGCRSARRAARRYDAARLARPGAHRAALRNRYARVRTDRSSSQRRESRSVVPDLYGQRRKA